MKWPETYMKESTRNVWLSCPSTSNILEAVSEKKRLANAYPESKIEIKAININTNNSMKYYFIHIEFTEEDEPVFIMQETM